MAVTLSSSYKLICSKATSTYSTLRLYGKVNSQDTGNNTSNITLQARLYGNGGSGSFSSGSIKITTTENNSTTSLGSTSYSKGSETTLKTWTTNVSHSADGSYTNKSVSAVLTSSSSPNGTASGTISVATIPRASQPSANPNPVDINGTTTISTNRASSSFTHNIKYVFGSLNGNIGIGTTDSVTWTIPNTFVGEFSSTERQKDCTINCVTFNGSTTIGTKSMTLVVRIPDSSRPTYTTPTKSETDASVISAIGSSMNKAIINLSKPRYQMTLASHDGANLKSVQIKCGDISNTINLSGTSYNLDYTFQNAMTSNVVQIIITDTRNIVTTYTDTYNNYETYTKPTITYQNITRSGLAGDVRIQLNGVLQATIIGSGTTNNISASFRYKENASGSSWSASTTLTSSISYNTGHNEWYLDITETGIASYDKSWIFEITLADSSTPNTPIVRTYTINKAVPTMSLGENDMQVNGTLFVSGTSQIQNGLYCKPTGQVNTPVGNSMLIVKRASQSGDSTPNNGVVLEFGNSANWTGQLYIGDNSTQGIYYNGWSNGTRGSWRRLADAPVVLYSNTSGTHASFQISETIGNFKEVEVMFLINGWLSNSVKMDATTSSISLVLSGVYGTGTKDVTIVTDILQISGTTATFANNRNRDGTLTASGSTLPNWSTSGNILVTKVLGYR